MSRIPVYRPSIGNDERAALLDAFDSGWISSRGEYVDRFERSFAEYTGAPFAASCSNGTTALHLALLALGIGDGDEVIVPSFTYVASVNAIRYVGAVPIFIDSDLESWQLDPAAAAKAITPKTKAIMAVHLYGAIAPMDEIMQLARANELAVIEDAAEAFGTRDRQGRHAGTIGDVGTFSFFGNKTITTGEGGMVVCRDGAAYDKVSRLKNHHADPDRRYWHDDIGYNYRMTNLAAAIGTAQLGRANQILARKAQIAGAYRAALDGAPLSFQRELAGTTHSHWMVSARLHSEFSRDDLMAFLANEDIETRPAFYPVHTLPMYAGFRPSTDVPNAHHLAAQGLNLPSFPDITSAEITRICDTIKLWCASLGTQAAHG